MIIDADTINDALDTIAKKFEQQYKVDETHDGCGGWGQFLDGPRTDRQIGLYGTSAGLLVLSLAERNDTKCIEGATKLLANWWSDRAAGYGRIKFPQNPRLAFLSLCLRNTPNEVAQQIAKEIEEELLTRATSNGRWGDYWLDKNIRDASIRYFPTALVTLSLSVIQPPTQKAAKCVSKTSSFLASTLGTNQHLTTAEKGLVTGAVIASSGSLNNRRARKLMSVLSRGPIDTLSENHAYFYEYEYANPETSTVLWDRDIVFLYSEIMLGIAGFLPGAPTQLRLRAERILQRLLMTISSRGSFRPLHAGRLSTVEQAWCCVLLALAREQAGQKRRRFGRIWYALVRQRQPHFVTELIFPIAATLAVTVIGALQIDYTPFEIIKVAALFVVYSLYGEKVIRRLLPS